MFKKPQKSRKNVRKRKVSSDDEEAGAENLNSTESSAIEMAKLRRELTKKSAGVSAASLAKGMKVTKEDELADDPFKINHGGGLTVIKDRKVGDKDRDVTNMSETFKVEKKIRDEEEEMNKFIETELLKRRGIECKKSLRRKSAKNLIQSIGFQISLSYFLYRNCWPTAFSLSIR